MLVVKEEAELVTDEEVEVAAEEVEVVALELLGTEEDVAETLDDVVGGTLLDVDVEGRDDTLEEVLHTFDVPTCVACNTRLGGSTQEGVPEAPIFLKLFGPLQLNACGAPWN